MSCQSRSRNMIVCPTLLLILLKVSGILGQCSPLSNIVNTAPVFAQSPLVIDGSVNSSGVITSTNFPQNYNALETCLWVIKAPEGSRTRLTFTAFNIGDVTTEVLGVLDGNSLGSPYTNFITNTNTIPPPFESTTNIIGLIFRSGPTPASGWRLTWTIITPKPKEQPLLFIDSNTSTLMLAVGIIMGLFLFGLVPIETTLQI